MNMIRTSLLLPLFALSLTACGGSVTETADIEGCEHLKEGPAAPVTATSAATGAPEVSNDHKRYDVTLPSGAAGYVSFAPSMAHGYVFFLSQAVPFAVKDAAGADVTVSSSSLTGAKCPEVKGRHLVSLGVGTYRLVLGPAAGIGTVGMVVEEESHAH